MKYKTFVSWVKQRLPSGIVVGSPVDLRLMTTTYLNTVVWT